MSVFINDPLEIVMDVFRERYPEVEVKVWLYYFPEDMASHGFGEGQRPAGLCGSPVNGGHPHLILLDAGTPYEYMTGSLVHELAHAVVGMEPPPYNGPHEHGPAFRKVFMELYGAYMQALLTPENQAKHPPDWAQLEASDALLASDSVALMDRANTEIMEAIEREEAEEVSCDQEAPLDGDDTGDGGQ